MAAVRREGTMKNVSDKQVWESLTVFEDEVRRWSQNGFFPAGSSRVSGREDPVFIVRSRLAYEILPGDLIMSNETIERLDFKSREDAEQYIRWRAVHAVLKAL